MSEQTKIRARGPSHIELIMTPGFVPDVTPRQAEMLWKELGNPVKPTGEPGVHEIGRVKVDHSEAAEGEFVWACDYCGAYSKSRLVVESHEQACDARPTSD